MNLLSAFGGSVCVIAVQVLLIHLPAIASATETAKANEAPPLKTFQIYHSYTKNNEFKPRGTIQLIKEEDGSVTASVHNGDEEGSGSGSFLNDATFEGIDALVSSGGYYKLKIVDEESGASSMTSVSGCDVRRAYFREEIQLNLGNEGSIISVSYKPLASPLTPDCHELEPLAEASKKRDIPLKSIATFAIAKPAMVIPAVLPQTNPPRGYDWIQRKKSADGNNSGSTGEGTSAGTGTGTGGAGGGGGFIPGAEPGPENQSFLRKYWYIVVPITIMTFLGPEEPAKGGAVKGAAAAPNGGNKQRRGKRG